jgi:L-prolyl-PCP dehydrogenase
MSTFELSPEQLRLKTEFSQFVREELNKISIDEEDRLIKIRKKWEIAGQTILPGLPIPKEMGGRGNDVVDTFILLEELGHSSMDQGFNFGICAHMLACVVPIWLFGNTDLQGRFLPDACTGRKIIGNAMSEPASGSDAFQMATYAAPTDGGYKITGHKNFVSNVTECDIVLLYARTNEAGGAFGGISAFVLDLSECKVSKEGIWDKSGLHSCSLGGIFIDQLEVGSSCMLGPEGRGAHIFNKSMEWERALLGAIHLGNSRRLIDHAINLLRSYRNKDGREYQWKAQKVAEWYAQLEATYSLAFQTASKMNNGKNAAKEAAMTKWMVSENYRQIAFGIMTIFGIEYPDQTDMKNSINAAAASGLYSGTSEIQKLIIGQQLGF